MKSYFDIAGDGGSRILDQGTAQRRRIETAFAGVRHVVAVGSGKGGVGKSTLSLGLARALAASRGSGPHVLDRNTEGLDETEVIVISPPGVAPGTVVARRAS